MKVVRMRYKKYCRNILGQEVETFRDFHSCSSRCNPVNGETMSIVTKSENELKENRLCKKK